MITSHVEPPVAATAVLVDLRNFTPNLKSAGKTEDGTNAFCFFLADFYDATLEAVHLALGPNERANPPIAVNSTGDGMLLVFWGKRHFANGLLAAFLLNEGLRRCCTRGMQAGYAGLGFGVGVESGEACVIHTGSGPSRAITVIGHCVNVAARMEGLTKVVANANVAIGDALVERCVESFFGLTFEEVRRREAAAVSDDDRVALQMKMDEMNRSLCLIFLERFVLKGVDTPLPVYRIDTSAVQLGVDRFDKLLLHLVDGSELHLADVASFFGRGV